MKAKIYRRLSFSIIFFCWILSFWVGKTQQPVAYLDRVTLDMSQDKQGLYFMYKGSPKYVDHVISDWDSLLGSPDSIASAKLPSGYVEVIRSMKDDLTYQYEQVTVNYHWSFWSLLPAIVTLLLCWATREPVTALITGIISGALLLGKYNVLSDVFVPGLMLKNSATIILIYLILLGGLLGIWSKTGAAACFAEWMTRHFVRGPISAKLVTWGLGILFFQGGTMSVVLVGSTVKPITDKENVSHEELAYIVDSTASPIASQLAFNAWPAYVQAFIYVSGVHFLATEVDRIAFFFKSVPFCFYAIFAVLGTFLLAIEKPVFLGKQLKQAIKRARQTGALDSKSAVPLSSPELNKTKVPDGYRPHIIEFILPIFLILGLSIGSFIVYGSPDIVIAFSIALVAAFFLAMFKGMRLVDVMDGIIDGMKSLVLGLIILLCAMMIGQMSIETGAGLYLTDLLGDQLPYWILPVVFQIISVCIAFSTGTSWGTYAIVFPIAMPLAWAVSQYVGLSHPELFMTLCFAAVMDGAVYGDQCSPISDTTVLTAMCH